MEKQIFYRMKIEALRWLLEEIQKGNNTLYKLKQLKSSVVQDYLNYALTQGYITLKKEGNKKVYDLTERGKGILKYL